MEAKLFVNLPVRDLQKTKDFFSGLGFSYNPQFSDDKAACMIINGDSNVMLLTEDFFKSFTKKGIVNAHNCTEVLTSISAESRDRVNEIVNKAISLGATEARDPDDYGYMYTRSFNDPDGHIWEVAWMDLQSFPKA
ncbi:MAG: VOC family protein [Bacteroidales bacterium]